MTAVRLATGDASAGKSYGLEPSLARPTVSNGSARSGIGGTVATGRNCVRVSRRLRATSLRPNFRRHALGSRLDGQYGTGAVLSDLAGFGFVTRGKDYTVLDHPLVQARLHLPPDQLQQRPESQMVRSLYDCPGVPVGSEGVSCRVVVATHPASKQKSPVGVTRAGIVYELFFTNLPQQAFTTSDVVELYLHRGAFEPALADEDQEIDPDRWCSHTACGQEAWCIVSQWVWNLRLELGHQLEPTPLRTTEFAPAQAEANAQQPVTCGYGKPTGAAPWKAGRFSGQDFALQPDGTLRCPANQTRIAHTNGARKPMGVYAWSMPPASAVVVPVPCASSVNGMAALPRSPARSAYSCIRSSSALPRYSGATGAGERSDAPVCNSCDTNTSR